jgi:ParB-like chromosome segregation protein Spo0J
MKQPPVKQVSKLKALKCTCDPDGRLERVEPGKLVPYQRELKTLTDAGYAQLKASMERFGFTVPVFAWKAANGELLVLDGHQRLRVLQREGWTVAGGVPVVTVEAASEREAAEKLLVIASQYGTLDKPGLFEFATHYQLDIAEFDLAALPDVTLDWQAFLAEFTDKGEPAPDDGPEDDAGERLTTCPKCGHQW